MAVAVTTESTTRAKKSKIKNNNKSNVLLVAQELKFIKNIAGNDKRLRDKVLKRLRRWLTVRSESSFVFTDNDFLRLWKGLFYCMWMSDKPLVQEQLSENIANLVHCFKSTKIALQFYKCFLKTMQNEWFGIDQLRLDKFLMLVRRVLRQCLVVVAKTNWKTTALNRFGNNLSEVLLVQQGSLGLVMHMSEIYIEEISKVSSGNLPEDAMTLLLKPFTKYLSECCDARPITHVCNNVFRVLMAQTDAGQEHQAKFEAWRNQGFPGGNIDCMAKVEVSEDEDEDIIEEEVYEKPIKSKKKKNKKQQHHEEDADEEDLDKEDIEYLEIESALDPRAGKVDVELSQIPFNAGDISEMILSFRFNKGTNTRSRKALTSLAEEFKLLAEGTFPLGIRQVQSIADEEKSKPNIRKSALELIKVENKFRQNNLKRLNKKQRKRHLKMLQEEEQLAEIGDSNEQQDDEDDADTIKSMTSEEGDVIKERKLKKKKRKLDNIGEVNTVKAKKVKTVKSIAEASSVKRKKLNIVENNNKDTPRKAKSVENNDEGSSIKRKKLKIAESNDEATPKNSKSVGNNDDGSAKRKKLNIVANNDEDTPRKVKTVENNNEGSSIKRKKLKIVESNDEATPKNSKSVGNNDEGSSIKRKKLNIVANNDEFTPRKPKTVENNIITPKKAKVIENGTAGTPSPTVRQKTVVVSPKKSPKKQSNNNSGVWKVEEVLKTPKNKPIASTPITSTKKQVKIVEHRNISQDTHEYERQLRSSPQIPYDASRKPSKTLLKPNLVPSPINPFYIQQNGIKF